MGEARKTTSLSSLERWFPEPRMSRYALADDPSALYVWDVRLQKAFLEDVAHVEVLLRNFIAERLAIDCKRALDDRAWYDHSERYNTSQSFLRSVSKVKNRLRDEGKEASYDRVIAGLTMDVWRFLLVSRLEPIVWRALRDVSNGGMPNHPGTSRADFEEHVASVYELRNRCSHQEHLVQDDVIVEEDALDRYADALDWVARKIDPEAAAWIRENSRVSDVRARRPKRSALSNGKCHRHL